jgi:hypothetical protein
VEGREKTALRSALTKGVFLFMLFLEKNLRKNIWAVTQVGRDLRKKREGGGGEGR